MSDYEIIDYARWPRRELFEFFSHVSNPFYSVTFKLDVTRVYEYAKAKGLSFYYALTWLVTKAINSVEAFRYAVIDGKVVLLPERLPSFTDMKDGSEQFHIVTRPAGDDIGAFCLEAKRRSMAQTEFIVASGEGPNLLYISCLPWVELTSLTNERDFDPDDAIPRIAWGKYRDIDGRKELGLSLELNHRFADGYHIGKFNEALCALISRRLPRSDSL